MNEKSFLRRYLIMIGFFAAICLIFVIRLASFQFFGDNEEDYREYGVKNFKYTVTIPALRSFRANPDRNPFLTGTVLFKRARGLRESNASRCSAT